MSDNSIFKNCEIISSYSRAQAIEDGMLIDVTDWAKGMFKVPVALTATLWNTLENIPEESLEDVRGRTHDVLFLAAISAKRANEPRLTFEVIVTPKTLTLMMDIGPGDEGEPVITIGFSEDF